MPLPSEPPLLRNRLLRALLIGLGSLSLALGVVGIVVPLLPTTPFLILAAACYLRSSERLYRWLTRNRVLGDYLHHYHRGNGIPLKVKVLALGCLWVSILASTWLVIPEHLPWGKALLLAIALGVTVQILRIRTRR